MKTRFLIPVIISAMIPSIIGCNADNLNLTNPNLISAEQYFNNENEVQMAVNAIYTNLQTRGLYQRGIYYALDNLAYEQRMSCCVELDHLDFSYYSFGPENGIIRDYWKNCYAGIRKANYVINQEDAINHISENRLSTVMKQKYLGEAHFLRAFYYFLLVTRFGDIPLYTTAPEDDEGMKKSRATDIWSLIENDLIFAAENCLPKNKEEKGRATCGAAWALLGKTYLFRSDLLYTGSDFYLAREAFLNVINDKENYSLEHRYLNNFEEETEHGPESIFEVEFDPKLGYGNIWSADDNGTGFNEGTFRGREYGFRDWFNVFPTDNLLDEFEKNDPRFSYCFYSLGDTFNQGRDTIKDLSKRAVWRKYQNYYKQEWEENASGINFKVIRMADVLLMMAEAENRMGNTSEAVKYLNEIRNRDDVQMPEYGSPEVDSLYPVDNWEQIQKAIEHERKVELCGEQIRFNDLVRWRRLDRFMKTEIVPYLDPWIMERVRYDPGKHYLWPIPQSEIDNNKALSEDDQNPGY